METRSHLENKNGESIGTWLRNTTLSKQYHVDKYILILEEETTQSGEAARISTRVC